MGSNYLIKVVIEGDNCDIFVLKYFVLMELKTINQSCYENTWFHWNKIFELQYSYMYLFKFTHLPISLKNQV